MKVVVIFACLLVLVAADSVCEFQQYIKFMSSTIDMCADKLEMGKEIVEKVKTRRIHTDVDTVGCMEACMLKNFNVLQNGKINVPANYDLIDTIYTDQPDFATKLKNVAAKCSSTVKYLTNECEIALNRGNCYIASLDKIN